MFGGHFGQFFGFGGISVIFQFQGVFWSFLCFMVFWLYLFQVLMLFCSFFRFRGYLGHFISFGDILVILQVYVVFQTFFRFRGYLGLFFQVWRFLVIFYVWGTLDNFQVSAIFWSWGVFWSIFRFQGCFGHFLGLRGNFHVSGVFQSFFRVQVIQYLFQVSRLFCSFYWFCGYLGHFISFKDILVILQVYVVFLTFFMFRGYFVHFMRQFKLQKLEFKQLIDDMTINL